MIQTLQKNLIAPASIKHILIHYGPASPLLECTQDKWVPVFAERCVQIIHKRPKLKKTKKCINIRIDK